MSFMEEIRKIPPVTRFLCGSSLLVTLPVMVHLVSPYKWLFVTEYVTKKYEFWRIFTSFFLGASGLNYLFDFIMLYRNSDQLESLYYTRRSADYAWQLLLAAASILAMNIPLGSFIHTRPLLVALTYLSSRLAPPGTQTSLFGLVSMPVIYYPYVLIAFDLVMAGPSAAAASVTGAVAGHLWWWGIWDTRALEAWGTAPGWLKGFIPNSEASGRSGGGGSANAVGGGSGVRIIPPWRAAGQQETAATVTGHVWGSGNRLGQN